MLPNPWPLDWIVEIWEEFDTYDKVESLDTYDFRIHKRNFKKPFKLISKFQLTESKRTTSKSRTKRISVA